MKIWHEWKEKKSWYPALMEKKNTDRKDRKLLSTKVSGSAHTYKNWEKLATTLSMCEFLDKTTVSTLPEEIYKKNRKTLFLSIIYKWEDIFQKINTKNKM